jgi:hypothetical protein
MCEQLYSHDEVVKAVEEVLGDELNFARCASSSAQMHAVREKINAMIKAKV